MSNYIILSGQDTSWVMWPVLIRVGWTQSSARRHDKDPPRDGFEPATPGLGSSCADCYTTLPDIRLKRTDDNSLTMPKCLDPYQKKTLLLAKRKQA